MGKAGSRWRHGFVPTNLPAALQKAHGNRSYADKLLGRRTTNRQHRKGVLAGRRRRSRSRNRRRR